MEMQPDMRLSGRDGSYSTEKSNEASLQKSRRGHCFSDSM